MPRKPLKTKLFPSSKFSLSINACDISWDCLAHTSGLYCKCNNFLSQIDNTVMYRNAWFFSSLLAPPQPPAPFMPFPIPDLTEPPESLAAFLKDYIRHQKQITLYDSSLKCRMFMPVWRKEWKNVLFRNHIWDDWEADKCFPYSKMKFKEPVLYYLVNGKFFIL